MRLFNFTGYTLLLFFLIRVTAGYSQTAWVKQLGGADGDAGVGVAVDPAGHVYTIGTFTGSSSFGSFTLSSSGKGDVVVSRMNAATGAVEWVRQLGGINEDNGNAVSCDASGNVYCVGRFSGQVAFGTYTLNSVGTYDIFAVKLDAANGSVLWAKRLGGSGSDGGLAVVADASGNIYTSGYFQGTATFGTVTLSPVGTNFNIYLTRLDASNGNVIWAKGYGSSGYSFGSSLSCDASGDIYMTGNFESQMIMGTNTLSAVQYQDIFVSKHYATTGNPAWAVSAGGQGNDNGNGITVSSDGAVYTTGKFEDNAAFGSATLTSAGSSDIFVSKRDALTGNLVWVKQFGSSGYEQANAIAHDADGSILVTGQFGGFVTFGNDQLLSAGNADLFIAKVNPVSGNIAWAMGMGGAALDSGYGIAMGPANALYAIGSFQSGADFSGTQLDSRGGADVFVLKLNSVTVGITEYGKQATIRLMPVPAKEKADLFIESDVQSSYKIRMTDLSGSTVMSFSTEKTHEEIDLSTLPPGIYFLSLTALDGSAVVKKLVKQ